MVAAALGAVIEGPPVGLVVGRPTSATAAAVDDALAQGKSLSGRTCSGARGVGSQSLLIGQILLPADEPRMMILDYDGPFGAGLFIRRVADGPIGTDNSTRAEASKDVGAGVRRVREDADDARMRQSTPAQFTSPHATIGSTWESSAGESAHHTIRRAGRLERGENVCDCRGYLLVRVNDRAALGIPNVAYGQSKAQLTPFGGGAFGAVQAASQDVEFGFRHSPFEPEQQPIVELAQVVHTIGIDDQRVGQAGQFQQPRQVGVGARQASNLQAKDGSHLA